MTVSTAGLSDAGSAFHSAAPTGNPKIERQSLALALDEALLGVVKNQIDFSANVTNEIVQSIPQAQGFSLYG